MKNATKHKNTYLGLDIGTASIGYALIDEINGSIIASGVRIFPEALEGTSEDNKKPKNVERREKRSRRRQTRHKKLKQKRIREILFNARLLPSAEESVLEQTSKNSSPNEPYDLRKRALNEKLDFYELGRVFTHISRRIGFSGSVKKDNLEEDEKTDEQKKQEKDENEIKGEIKNKTLGTYLADLPSQERKRGRHIGRSMIEDEFDAIWNKQKQYHPDLLTEDLRDSLKKAIFWRRHTFWRLKSLGKCPYEPESPLLMKADWKAQQYIMLQNLNNLRVAPNNRQLKPEERQLVYDLMMSSAKVSFSSIRKKLKNYWKENNIPTTSKFNFEYKADERKDLPGNATEALLRKVLGNDYANLSCSEKIKLEIAEQKFNVKYHKRLKGYRSKHKGWRIEILDADETEKQEKVFIQKAVDDWQITKEQAKKLVDAPLPKDWIRFSKKVVDRILPQLEEGKEFQTTLDALYPPHDIMGENRDKLPSHHKVFSNIRNPVVVRCLNETRKVINNLIATYGKPDYIRVELARNIKLAGKDKKKAMKINKKRRAQRGKARKFLAENNLEITDSNITKHILWEESNQRCLYSGNSICADDLFNNGEYQIEHIMPRSRSDDNSPNNLLLCKTEMNLQKRNHTPYEAFGGDTALWEEMVKRVKDKKLKLPKPKIKRFIRESYPEELNEEQKKSRLTDTGYATCQIRDFIATLYSRKNAISWIKGQPPKVQVVNGQITSQIGRAWNVYHKFNKKFIGQFSTKKIRDDHRHHTLDAIIVALTSIERAQYIAKRFREKREEGIAYEEIVKNLRLRLPWDEFHKDVHNALEKIIVSYQVDAKVSGSFSKDTHMRKQKTKKNELRYVKRINLSDATANDIRNICDEQVKELVWNHVRKYDEIKVMPEKPEDEPWLNDKTVSKSTMTASINSAIKEAFKDNNQPLRMKCKKRNKNGETILGPVIKKVRIEVKQEEHLTIPVHAYKRNNKEINIVAEKGDNHHVALYRKDNGDIEKRVISKLEAQQRIQKDKPLIEPRYNGLPLVFSYCKRDVFIKIDPKTDKLTFHRVDIIGEKQVTLYLHTLSSKPKPEKRQPSHHLLLENGYWKVTVDPIGRISLVNKNLAFYYLPNLRKHFE